MSSSSEFPVSVIHIETEKKMTFHIDKNEKLNKLFEKIEKMSDGNI